MRPGSRSRSWPIDLQLFQMKFFSENCKWEILELGTTRSSSIHWIPKRKGWLNEIPRWSLRDWKITYFTHDASLDSASRTWKPEASSDRELTVVSLGNYEHIHPSLMMGSRYRRFWKTPFIDITPDVLGLSRPTMSSTLQTTQTITIFYFAAASTATGKTTEQMPIPSSGLSLSSLSNHLTLCYPNTNLGRVLETSQWCVNEEMVDDPVSVTLMGGEQVAVIPPVSGGWTAEPECSDRIRDFWYDEKLSAKNGGG